MKILIISEFYPPLNNIASGRPSSFAKYLSIANEVTVITVKKEQIDGDLNYVTNNEKYTLIEVERPYERGLDFINKFGWVFKAYPKVKDTNWDVVISTSNPWQVHLLAKRLKAKRKNTKWIADYRDLWSKNFHTSASKGYRAYVHHFLEKRIANKVDLFTTVSQPLAEQILKMFPKKKAEVIYNGFEGTIKSKNQIKTNDKLKITYCGNIYSGKSDPTSLFLAINELISEGKVDSKEVEVNFFGKRMGNLEDIIASTNSKEYVNIRGFVTREESHKEQFEADLLLFLESSKPQAKGVVTGKLFEYLSSGTPILSIGPLKDYSSSKLILKTKTGFVCENDVNLIKKSLLKIKESSLAFTPEKQEIEKFSRKNQAQKLEKIIYDICG